MKLEQLTIQHFSSIKAATLKLADRGLIVVEGTVAYGGADSNGSGKSSLINAILWCNYGDAGKKLKSVDDVINRKFGKNCLVECIWFDPKENKRYIVTRYRKHSVFKNEITVEHLQDGIRTNLTKGTNPETQLLINQILGGDQSIFEASCFARQSNAPDIPGMTDGELKALLEAVLPFDDLNGYYKAASRKLNDKQSKLAAIKSDLNSKLALETEISDQLDATRKRQTSWAAGIAVQRKTLEFNILNYEDRIANLNADLIKRPTRKIEASIAKQQVIIDAFDTLKHRNIELHHLGNLKQLAKVTDDILNIDKLSACSLCGQSIKDEVELLKHYKELEEELEILTSTSRKEYEASIKGLEVRSKAIETLDKLKILKSDNALKVVEIERVEGEIKALDAQIEGLATNPHDEAVKALETRWTAILEQISNGNKARTECEAEIAVLEGAVETFSPKGVRYYILESVTPTLNERTNYYLSILTDGAYKASWSTVSVLKSGDYREKFSIEVSGKEHGDYGSLSGGEQRKVRLACFFALQDLIASRATKSINLWVGDEIDHALDGAGLERLVSLLTEKATEKSTILVISHNDLSGWIPNKILVTKTNGISEIIDGR